MVPNSDWDLVAPPTPPAPKIYISDANTVSGDPHSPPWVTVPISLFNSTNSNPKLTSAPTQSLDSVPSPPKNQCDTCPSPQRRSCVSRCSTSVVIATSPTDIIRGPPNIRNFTTHSISPKDSVCLRTIIKNIREKTISIKIAVLKHSQKLTKKARTKQKAKTAPKKKKQTLKAAVLPTKCADKRAQQSIAKSKDFFIAIRPPVLANGVGGDQAN